MIEFLFVFGYESPDERAINTAEGTDFESSQAVWITAPDEEAALKAGRSYADAWVAELFREHGIHDSPNWTDSNFAHWIEHKPLERFSGMVLDVLDRIDVADGPQGQP